MARDPEVVAHQEWLGFVQPVGLVVSIPALLQAQAYVNRNIAPDHQRFHDCLPDDDDAEKLIRNFPAFTREVLGWEANDLVGSNGQTLPGTLEVTLPEYNETLRPTYAVPEFDREGKNERWIMLIKTLLPGTDLDEVLVTDERRWQASPQARFERLLRETGVPIGLLFNGTEIRLVYAPRGETSGHATFRVAEMAQVAGRPIFAALHMLLNGDRLFSLPEKQRLPAILEDSRKYQNVVSTKLAEQVLAALYDLLRGFQAADDQRKGDLFRELIEDDPNQVYAGLLTTLLRLVFILYAEDRGLLSNDPVYVNHYSVTGLFERLRGDAGRFPDTMDQRYGAWAQLLVLFRLIYDGGSHGPFRIPGRKGYLFDPDRYPFLEGRPKGSRRDDCARLDVPRVSDGVIFRVLNNLLILDGERLSYRSLDVEQIGSVYETMMGFDLEVATGPSIAIKPVKRHGAPATINLEDLLAAKPAARAKWLRDHAEQKITGQAAEGLKKAESINDLLAALEKKIAKHATPSVAPKGAMVLQPSDERRRSGSHYTPRSLTEPIVRKTLEPVLGRLALGDGEWGRGDPTPSPPPTPQFPAPSSPPAPSVPTPATPRRPAGPGAPPAPTPQLLTPTHEVRHEPSHSVVPRSPGLAPGHGPGRIVLRDDEGFSAGGELRPDQPDSAGGRLDSGEHRGGSRPGQPEGVPPVPSDGAGEPAGIGNARDVEPAGRSAAGAGGDLAPGHRGSVGPHAPGPPEVPREAPSTPHSLTPSSPSGSPTPHLLAPSARSPTPNQILALKVCDPAMGSGAFLVEACRQLGDALVKSWYDHDCVPAIPPDEDERLHARRIIAQRCLYGVDKNPMAVDLAKLSLWLATLAKDHPFTFLDHALRCGDSLVGLTRRQIAEFDWEMGDGEWELGVRSPLASSRPPSPNSDSPPPPPKSQLLTPRRRSHRPTPQRVLGQEHIDDRIQSATESRARILAARDELPYERLRQELDAADEALDFVRFVGDLCIAAFFAEKKDRQRRARRDEYLAALTEYLRTGDPRHRPTAEVDRLRHPTPDSPHPISPFHWEIEFPEVFDRNNGGFDAFIGNPPFAGRNSLINSNRSGYLDWLKAIHEESHGNADLVAHFFRRAFNVLRADGCSGLIATNTIGQGDTRPTSLRWICSQGGVIYGATKRLKWPGQAAVVVSVVHICRGAAPPPCELNGRHVPKITAYLFHAGGHESPIGLGANQGKSFKGVDIYGLGFTFSRNPQGASSSLDDMDALVTKDPRNRERLSPYIGGEDLNQTPDHTSERYVINFEDMHEREARQWPDLMRIVEEKVKPERMALRDTPDGMRLKQRWWLFSRTRPEMRRTIAGLRRVLVIARVGNAFGFTFVPRGQVLNEKIIVFPFEDCHPFALLQSRVHEIWARFFSSTLKDDLQYTPSECFDTFPFPKAFDADPRLELSGHAYYEFRAALMARNNEGLTKTYNRFHDPYEKSADILKLRELHAAMDRAVLDAYGWTDLRPTCEFLLDYEEEEEREGTGSLEMGGGARRTPAPHLPPPSSQRPEQEGVGSLEIGGRAGLTPTPQRPSPRSRRRKPFRYRWPDDFRDEVLARLLDLNQKRAAEERLAGKTGRSSKKDAGRTRGGRKNSRCKKAKRDDLQKGLFEDV